MLHPVKRKKKKKTFLQESRLNCVAFISAEKASGQCRQNCRQIFFMICLTQLIFLLSLFIYLFSMVAIFLPVQLIP